MKAIKSILVLLLILIVGVIIAALVTQKTNYDINQSLKIEASPDEVSEYISDLKTWAVWGPWNKEDTTIRTTYGEITKGRGASMSWTSADGPGELTMVEYIPGKSIATKLNMGGAPAEGYWNFEADGDGTKVTWGMKGKKNFVFKIAAMFMGFDGFMEKMQMTGLGGIQNNLGTYDSEVSVGYKLSEVTLTNSATKYMIGYEHKGEMDMEMIQNHFQEDMPKAGMFAGENQLSNYTPGAVWNVFDEESNKAEYVIGLIVNDASKMAEGMVKVKIPEGRILKISKFGPYGSGDKDAHETISGYMQDKGLTHVLTWEEYPNDPMEVKPAEVQTDIYYLVK